MWMSSQKIGGRIDDTRWTIREVQKETCYIILLHAVGNMLCIVISINMRCNPNLFYVSYFKVLTIIFLNLLFTK
jgi:hypothetical protein